MMRLPVRSRRWNMALAVLGSIYTVSAVVLLAWFVIDVWNAGGLADRLMQFALIASAVYSVWILRTALENLGIRTQRRWHTQRLSRSTAH